MKAWISGSADRVVRAGSGASAMPVQQLFSRANQGHVLLFNAYPHARKTHASFKRRLDKEGPFDDWNRYRMAVSRRRRG